MPTAATDRPMLSVRETAERLRLSESTVRRLIAAEVLPACRARDTPSLYATRIARTSTAGVLNGLGRATPGARPSSD